MSTAYTKHKGSNNPASTDSFVRQWEEYLAMWILEREFHIDGLTKQERPDLKSGPVGIEVTQAINQNFLKSEGDYQKHLRVCRSGDIDKNVRNGSVSTRIIVFPRDYNTQDFKLIKTAIHKKIKKAANYKGCQELRLYVFVIGGGGSEQYTCRMIEEMQSLLKENSVFFKIYLHEINCWKVSCISPDTSTIKELNSDYYNRRLIECSQNQKRRQPALK